MKKSNALRDSAVPCSIFDIQVLDQVIDAPAGIKRLRELILQLAVQGKLVEQRPEEGTAADLLKQIEEAKRQDAKERKARGERVSKQKTLPPIDKGEIPFEIPDGWKWVRLGLLISNPRYGTSKKCGYKTGATGVLRIPNVVRGYVDDSDLKFADFDDAELSQYQLEDGDLLAIRSNGSKSLVGRCAVVSDADTKYAYAGYLIRLRPFLLNSHYLMTCFNSAYVRSQIESRAKSTSGVNNVNAQEMSALILPLPPLLEQKRIVAKVDELMAWCDSLEALKEKRTALRTAALKATLNELVGTAVPAVRSPAEPVVSAEAAPPNGALGEHALPSKPSAPLRLCANIFSDLIRDPADVKPLRNAILQLAVQGRLVSQLPEDGTAADLLKQIEAAKRQDAKQRKANGERPRKDNPLPPITPEEIPFDIPKHWKWVKIGTTMDMINGKAFKPTDWGLTGLPIVRIQNLNKLDAPFNYCDAEVDPKVKITSGEFLISWSGTPGTSFGTFIWNRGNAVLNQHIFKCVLLGNAYLKSYLRIAINSRLDEMISHAQGAVGLQHITKGKLENMCITLPPLAEQQRIVAKVDELMEWCDELETLLQTESATATRFAAAIAQT